MSTDAPTNGDTTIDATALLSIGIAKTADGAQLVVSLPGSPELFLNLDEALDTIADVPGTSETRSQRRPRYDSPTLDWFLGLKREDQVSLWIDFCQMLKRPSPVLVSWRCAACGRRAAKIMSSNNVVEFALEHARQQHSELSPECREEIVSACMGNPFLSATYPTAEVPIAFTLPPPESPAASPPASGS